MALVTNVTALMAFMLCLFFAGAYMHKHELLLMLAKGTGKMISCCVLVHLTLFICFIFSSPFLISIISCL